MPLVTLNVSLFIGCTCGWQVERADRMFKSYQKLGHSFSNDVCNLMLLGWAKKVRQ